MNTLTRISKLRKILDLNFGRNIFSIRTSSEYNNAKNSEVTLKHILRERFPNATNINVTDLSGGCGAMYEVCIESQDFRGISLLKQHSIVNETLKEQIKNMHGIRILTKVPKENI